MEDERNEVQQEQQQWKGKKKWNQPAPAADPSAAQGVQTADYSGTERRNLGSSHIPPALTPERRKASWPASTSGPLVGNVNRQNVRDPLRQSLRAKFTVSEITKTGRGVTVLTFTAQHDHTIKGDAVLLPGSIPKGSISLEVDPRYAESLPIGSMFYLVSA
jgi:hypothetical protein